MQDLLLARGESGGVVGCLRRISETRPGRDLGGHDVLAAGAGEHGVGELLAARLLGKKPATPASSALYTIPLSVKAESIRTRVGKPSRRRRG